MSADYHTHTPLCLHAEGTPEEYIDAAITAGLTEYGISCHAPQQKPDGTEPFDDWRMLSSQIPAYLQWIDTAKQYAGDRIQIRSGLECDWLPGCDAWIQHLRSLHSWDYLIGSVHYITPPFEDIKPDQPWDFDNPAWIGKWAETVLASLHRNGRQRTLRYPSPPRPHQKIRLQTRGRPHSILRTCNRCHRHFRSYHRAQHCVARDAGVDLIISSDAHSPAEVARDRDKATSLAKKAGYTHTTLINQRQRSYVPIDLTI